MIDTCFPRSYIRFDVAEKLKMTTTSARSVVHELFGARDTEQITYKRIKAMI